MKTKVTLDKEEISRALIDFIKNTMPEHDNKYFKALRNINSFTFEISDKPPKEDNKK